MDSLVNSGDTAWMLFCSMLVFLLIPGFVFFYGGLNHQKNIPHLLTRCLLAVCLLTFQWVLFGYSLSFGPDHGGWIGNLSWAGLREVGFEPNLEYAGTIPHLTFMLYQGMIAIIPAALILGACGERMKLSAYGLFILLWSMLVYDPVAHWIWGVGGFLRISGVLDFAGGAVVYLTTGVAALAIAGRPGKRQDHSEPMASHTVGYTTFGAILIWLGSFGLNSGSAWTSGGLAASALVMTQVAAAVAGLTWAILDRVLRKRLTPLGVATGAVAGLIGITPCAGYVNLWGATFISIGVAMLCYVSLAVLNVRFGFDDSIRVFGLQGIGGIWGVLSAGLWATQSVNPNIANGLFYGHPAQLAIQVKATLGTTIYSFLMSWGLLKFVDLLIGLEHVPSDERLNIS